MLLIWNDYRVFPVSPFDVKVGNRLLSLNESKTPSPRDEEGVFGKNKQGFYEAAKAFSISNACSLACVLAEPVAVEAEAARPT